MERLIYVLIVLAVVAIAFRYALPQGDDASQFAAPTPAIAPVGTFQLPDFLLNQTARVIPTPNPDAEWAERLRLSGTDNVRSEPFELEGGLVRMRYTLDGNVTLLALSLIADGPQPQAGLPEVIATRVGEAERIIARPAGPYRLAAQSIGGQWSVVIEEEQPVETPAAASEG